MRDGFNRPSRPIGKKGPSVKLRACPIPQGDAFCLGNGPAAKKAPRSSCALARSPRGMLFALGTARRQKTSGGNRLCRAFHLHAETRAHIRPVVPDRFVVRTAVVPERD